MPPNEFSRSTKGAREHRWISEITFCVHERIHYSFVAVCIGARETKEIEKKWFWVFASTEETKWAGSDKQKKWSGINLQRLCEISLIYFLRKPNWKLRKCSCRRLSRSLRRSNLCRVNFTTYCVFYARLNLFCSLPCHSAIIHTHLSVMIAYL